MPITPSPEQPESESIEPTEDPDGASEDAAVTADFLPGLINCREEEDERVCRFATEKGIALAAFIAPYVGVKISPTQHITASIGLLEEFGAEELVQRFREAGVKKAYLLINSPGGGMDSSYKIARAIRMALDDVTTFVPHMAASGGTLLALTGNKLVMGSMSQLSPLDVQLQHQRSWVSAGSSRRFYKRATDWFKTVTPEDAPYPQRALVDRMDPYLMEEWSGVQQAMLDYTREILELAGYGSKSGEIAEKLVWSYPTHSYVINDARAKEIGLKVQDASTIADTWNVMRNWLGMYAVKQEMTHLIRYALPAPKKRRRKKQETTNEGSAAK